MAINSEVYPQACPRESVQLNVREEPSRGQPPRDGSSMKQKVTPPRVTGGIINTEDSDFSILRHKTGNICPVCSTRVPALLAKGGRNPGKGYKGEFACTQCASFGVSDNPAFWAAR